MFTPRDPYEREQKHGKSRRSLSIAQILAMQTIDVETVALIWLMIERGICLTVAGPTEPKPGAGKTTALHALLQFLPQGAAVVYTSGMFETFAFTRLPDIDPTNTCALCSEISDHLQTYMWGHKARRFLMLPGQGYRIATSVHADTIDDVLHLYQHDLRLRIEDIRRLGLVINIGLMGNERTPLRRWISTYFLQPQADPQHPEAILKLPLSLWNEQNDTFEHADPSVLEQLAAYIGLSSLDFTVSHKQRVARLKELAKGKGADMRQVYDAIHNFKQQAMQETNHKESLVVSHS
ncbi:MAG: hypothetical protein ACXVBU_17500 [Ktedonobacteraceae bacterium]